MRRYIWFLLILLVSPLQAQSQSIDTQGKDINTRGGDITTSGGSIFTGAGTILGNANTVSSLPVCDTTSKGSIKYVTDAAASPVYNATVASGGSVAIPVFCNGTNWVNH